jgi:hypothetical protein
MLARRESAQHPVSQSAAGDPFTIGTDEHRVRSLPATGSATIWHTDWPGSTRWRTLSSMGKPLNYPEEARSSPTTSTRSSQSSQAAR